MEKVYGLLSVGALGVFIWGCWWITKTFSYILFYEGMVKDTVMQVLTSQGLI